MLGLCRHRHSEPVVARRSTSPLLREWSPAKSSNSNGNTINKSDVDCDRGGRCSPINIPVATLIGNFVQNAYVTGVNHLTWSASTAGTTTTGPTLNVAQDNTITHHDEHQAQQSPEPAETLAVARDEYHLRQEQEHHSDSYRCWVKPKQSYATQHSHSASNYKLISYPMCDLNPAIDDKENQCNHSPQRHHRKQHACKDEPTHNESRGVNHIAKKFIHRVTRKKKHKNKDVLLATKNKSIAITPHTTNIINRTFHPDLTNHNHHTKNDDNNTIYNNDSLGKNDTLKPTDYNKAGSKKHKWPFNNKRRNRKPCKIASEPTPHNSNRRHAPVKQQMSRHDHSSNAIPITTSNKSNKITSQPQTQPIHEQIEAQLTNVNTFPPHINPFDPTSPQCTTTCTVISHTNQQNDCVTLSPISPTDPNPKKLERYRSSFDQSSDKPFDHFVKEAKGVLSNNSQHDQQQQQVAHVETDTDKEQVVNSISPNNDGNDINTNIDHIAEDDDDDHTLLLRIQPSSDSNLFSHSTDDELVLPVSVKNRVQDIEHRMGSFDDDDDHHHNNYINEHNDEPGCFTNLSPISSCSVNSVTNHTTTRSRPPQCVFDFFPTSCIKLSDTTGERPPLPPYVSLPPQSSISFPSSSLSNIIDCHSVTSDDSDTTELLNHTLKLVFLGSGNDNLSNSLIQRPPSREAEQKKGVHLSVESWTPLSSNDNHNHWSSSSSSRSTIGGDGDVNFSLWEMGGLAKDCHHATRSICISPNSLYAIVYKIPPSYQYPDESDCEEDFFEQEDAEEKSERALQRHMDEHFFSWVDLLTKHAPKGCAILPVVSCDYDGDEDSDTLNRIDRCCNMLKQRILKERRCVVYEVPVDDWDPYRNGTGSQSSSPKIVFHRDNIPKIFPSKDGGSRELRDALCDLALWGSVFQHHLHNEITPVVSCVRTVISGFKKDGYNVIPLNDLFTDVRDNFPEITIGEVSDAVQFLSSVGYVMFFTKEDEEDSLRIAEESSTHSTQDALSKFVILEPKWMACVVSCIFRDDWKTIRSKLNDTKHRRNSSVSLLGGCISSCKTTCPILSAQDSADIWKAKKFIMKSHDEIAKLGSDDLLLLFLRQACEHCGIFIPLPIDGSTSSLATIADPSAEHYLVPGLCPEDPEQFWSVKSKEKWKITLSQSWLLENRPPCEMFDQVTIAALDELNGMVDAKENTGNTNNMIAKVRVDQLMRWKASLYIKLIETPIEPSSGSNNVELFIKLVDSDSPECPASHTLKKGTKLVVSASGDAAHDGEIIWRYYRNILDSIESVVKKAIGGELKREVSCPGCMANSDPCKANVWQLNDYSVYDQTQPTLYCEAGHQVSTKMIYGPRDDDTDATTVCTTCTCTSSITSGTFREERPEISIEKLLGRVVLVGLWDTKEECVVGVGTGFFADGHTGLILTAGHIFHDVEEGKKVGPRYKGLTDAKIIIGTMKSEEGNGSDTAHFTYSAEIIYQDMANMDAVVLRITNKFEEPFQCSSWDLKPQPDVPIMHGKFKREEMKKLGLRDAHLEEQVRIIGFVQSGEGRYDPEPQINYTASIAKGYVCKKGNCVSASVQSRKDNIFSPRSEMVVELTAYVGQSGGPCVNQDGKVIGIVSRIHPNDDRRCYLVPSSELKKILRKANKKIAN